jgi:hypothetical protein
MTRAEFFTWLQSFRSLRELDDRGRAIAELLSGGLGQPIYNKNSDEIQTINLTTSGLEHLPIVLPPTRE